jgi:hypothetical protein
MHTMPAIGDLASRSDAEFSTVDQKVKKLQVQQVGIEGKALVGTLHIIAAERVQILAMSVSAALDALSRLGVGFAEAWAKNSVPGAGGC